MFLTDQDIAELTKWRRELHRFPELSREEAETARKVQEVLLSTGADRILTNLGGHGIAGVYKGSEPGPTVMLRAELDGLPIQEISSVSHRSTLPGKAHLCGHDGHMTILTALAIGLGRQRPMRGRAILMFQPAEEDGSGAAAVVADPKFAEIVPDFAFALHNLPGMPFGKVALAEGPVSCASMGIRIVLSGKTAHASMPEFGISPVGAIAQLIPALRTLGPGGALDESFAMVTVTHIRVGEPAFGIAPAHGEIWATLRTLTDSGMEHLRTRAVEATETIAHDANLGLDITYHDVFRHCENASEAVAYLRRALEAEGVPYDRGDLPMRPSEDFGRFSDHAPAAMFFVGAGESHPSLHNPDYDFPDELIGIGARVFMRTVRDILG